jgi:hypothetical protein
MGKFQNSTNSEYVFVSLLLFAYLFVYVDKMGSTLITHIRDEKFVQHFSLKPFRKAIFWRRTYS